GGTGGAGGYGGITNSFAVKFDLYSGGTHTSTTGLYTGGDNPGEAPGTGNSIALGFDLRTGTPVQVTLAYDGTNLVETVVNTATCAQIFSHTYVLNLSSVLGGSTSALVGFTGGTGGETATQDILNWEGTFQPVSGSLGSAKDSSGNGNTGTLMG